MISLVESEARVVALARASLGAGGGVAGILRERCPTADALGPTAVSALEQTLSRASVHRLARAGWKVAFWRRGPPVQLRFTAGCVRVLQWAVSQPLGREDLAPTGVGHLSELGDELVLLGLARLLARHSLTTALNRPPFATSPLVALALGDAMPIVPVDPDWLGGGRDVALEALADELAEDAVRIESFLLGDRDADHLARVGEARGETLGSLLDALERAGRRDLAGFLVRAGREFPDSPLDLGVRAPLSERQRGAVAAGAQLRAIARIGAWADDLAALRFFDEGYDDARALLAAWDLDARLRVRLVDRERARRDLSLPRDVRGSPP